MFKFILLYNAELLTTIVLHTYTKYVYVLTRKNFFSNTLYKRPYSKYISLSSYMNDKSYSFQSFTLHKSFKGGVYLLRYDKGRVNVRIGLMACTLTINSNNGLRRTLIFI